MHCIISVCDQSQIGPTSWNMVVTEPEKGAGEETCLIEEVKQDIDQVNDTSTGVGDGF